jgi:hypothetical protein
MNRTPSGLYIARVAPSFMRFRAKTRTITLPIDDSGTVRHVEHGDHLDATVRPNTVRMVFRPESGGQAAGGFARPNPIRTRAAMNTWRSNG